MNTDATNPIVLAMRYLREGWLGYIKNYDNRDIEELKCYLTMLLTAKIIEQGQQIIGYTENPYTVKCYDYNTNQYFNMTLNQEWIDKIEEDIWEALQ